MEKMNKVKIFSMGRPLVLIVLMITIISSNLVESQSMEPMNRKQLLAELNELQFEGAVNQALLNLLEGSIAESSGDVVDRMMKRGGPRSTLRFGKRDPNWYKMPSSLKSDEFGVTGNDQALDNSDYAYDTDERMKRSGGNGGAGRGIKQTLRFG